MFGAWSPQLGLGWRSSRGASTASTAESSCCIGVGRRGIALSVLAILCRFSAADWNVLLEPGKARHGGYSVHCVEELLGSKPHCIIETI